MTCYDTGEPKQKVTKIKVSASEDGGDSERGTNFAMKANSDVDINKSAQLANRWLESKCPFFVVCQIYCVLLSVFTLGMDKKGII